MEIGPYRVQRELGRGGMGVVYEALAPEGERLALKVLLDPALAGAEGLERFRREAEACRQLRHPNLVTYLDAGFAQGKPYVALALLEGPTLERSLREGGPLDPEDAARLCASLAEGLARAHEAGVVHRDVKPENVILVAGQPVLTDFGLARLGGRELERLTLTGEILGTPSYMAPEQASGEPGQISGAADVYALGATLYALVAGEPPFAAPSLLALLEQVMTQEPPRLDAVRGDVSDELASLVAACLAKSPAERPRARELAAALRALSAPGGPPPAPRPRAGRPLVLGGALALGGALVLGAASWAARGLVGGPAAPSPSPLLTQAAPPPALSEEALAAIDQARRPGDLAAAQAALEAIPPAARDARWHLRAGLMEQRRGSIQPDAPWQERAQEQLELALAGALPPAERARALANAIQVTRPLPIRDPRLAEALRLAPKESDVRAVRYAMRRKQTQNETRARLARAASPAEALEAIRWERAQLEQAFVELEGAQPPLRTAQAAETLAHFQALAWQRVSRPHRYYRELRQRHPEERAYVEELGALLGWIERDREAAAEQERRWRGYCAAGLDRDLRLVNLWGALRWREVELYSDLRQLGRAAQRQDLSAEGLAETQRFLSEGTAYRAGLAAYDQVCERAPSSAALRLRADLRSLWSRVALRSEAAHLTELALADMQRAIELGPRDPLNEFGRGLILERARRPLEAITAYARAAAKDRSFRDAWERRGSLCRAFRGEVLRELRRDLERAIAASSEAPELRGWLERQLELAK